VIKTSKPSYQEMDRSQPKPIKRNSFRCPPIVDTQRNIPISQSLPANYYSNLCPRAPLHRPTAAPKLPPALNLPLGPVDFQEDYNARTKKGENLSYSLKTYTGPAISASMPTWGKNPFLTGGEVFHRRKLPKLEEIPGSPHESLDFNPTSLTTLYLLNEDSNSRSSLTACHAEGKKQWYSSALKENAQSTSKMSESEDPEDDGETELQVVQDELFAMDL